MATPPPVPKKVPRAPTFTTGLADALAPRPPSTDTQLVRRRATVKLAPWMIDVAEKLFSKGWPQAEVADSLGVSASALGKWLALADLEDCTDDLLLEFAAACRAGRTEAKGLAIGNIHDAMKEGCVKTSQWWIERAVPAFNLTKKVETTRVEPEAPRVDDLELYTVEELEQWAEFERRKLAAGG